MSAEELFLDAKLFASAEADAYARWLDKNRDGDVDNQHTCTNMCHFEQFDRDRYPYGFVCLFSGQLHLCGSSCDKAKPTGQSGFVCALTSIVLQGRTQSSTMTISQGSTMLSTTRRNNKNKRKRQQHVQATKKVSARGPSASFLKRGSKSRKSKKPKSKKTIRKRIDTNQKERMVIAKTVHLLLFYRHHIPKDTHENDLTTCTTAVNHYVRHTNDNGYAARIPHMEAAAFDAVPRAEGRQPFIPIAENPFVQKVAEFLVEFVCRAYTHFRSVRTSISRWLKKPDRFKTVQVNQGHIDNHSSQVSPVQFAVELLIMCCDEIRSIADNRVLIPCIPFLTVFMPRPNQLRQIFADDSYKTLLYMGWFLELADMLYTNGCLPKDPSFDVRNLWPPVPSAFNYRSQRMLLIASATASSSSRAMEEVQHRTPLRPTDVISVPQLTQDYASDLSTRGVDGKRMTMYWCCLVDTDTGLEVVVATSDEVENYKSRDQVSLFFGAWTSRDMVDSVVGKWELSPDAVANGVALIQELCDGTRPDLKVFATDTVKSRLQ
jgi:hypothetical protein